MKRRKRRVKRRKRRSKREDREEEENVGDLVLGEGFHDGRGWSLSWFCGEQSQLNLNIDHVTNFPRFR